MAIFDGSRLRWRLPLLRWGAQAWSQPVTLVGSQRGERPNLIANAPIVEPGLRIRAVAKRIASPVGGAVELHWVPDPFPGVGDVLITNAAVAQNYATACATCTVTRYARTPGFKRIRRRARSVRGL